MVFKAITDVDEIEDSIVFKHSATCPISAAAYKEVEKFMEDNNADVILVIVQEQRDLSQEIATVSGVIHQSPQVIVFRDAAVTSHCSHWDITSKWLSKNSIF